MFGLGAFSVGSHPLAKHSNKRDSAVTLRLDPAEMLAHTSKELRPDEILLIRHARLLQFTAAGVDWVPTRDLSRELPVAANKGVGAEPMSEHIVALALAAAKRLFIEHAKLKHGEFNQGSANCCAAASAASSASAMLASRRRG